ATLRRPAAIYRAEAQKAQPPHRRDADWLQPGCTMPSFRDDVKGGGPGLHFQRLVLMDSGLSASPIPGMTVVVEKLPAGSASGEGDGSESPFGGKGRRLGER